MTQRTGINVRVSSAATQTRMRLRGGAVVANTPVAVDLGASDALTSASAPRADGGGLSVASGQYATVIPAPDGFAAGRVGVAAAAVADDTEGAFELGEDPEHRFKLEPVEVTALVLVDAASVAGTALHIGNSDGVPCFAPTGTGGAFAVLLQDVTTDDGSGPTEFVNAATVLLHPAGIPKGSVASISEALGSDAWQGDPVAARYVADEYYVLASQDSATALDSLLLTADESRLYKWTAPLSVTPQALGVYLTVGVDTSTTVILVYEHDTATGGPGALLFVSAALDTETADNDTFVGDTEDLPSFVEGVSYWLGVLSDDAITVRSQTVAAKSLLGHLAAVADTTPSTHLVLAAEDIAEPTDPWVYDVAQHATGECPVVIMQA